MAVQAVDVNSANAVSMKFYLILLFLVVYTPSWSQRPEIPRANQEKWFDQQIGIENSGLINGRPYKQKFMSSTSNPFFSESDGLGTVMINGQLYAATLLYDMFQDIVVAKHLSKAGVAWFIELDKITVDQFTIGSHVFRKYNGLFHEVLFAAQDFQVLARRTKVEQLIKSKSEYLRHDEVYLATRGRQSRIASLAKFKDLVSAKDEKKKVLAFMREQKLRKRKITDENLIAMGAFVQSLRDNRNNK